MLLIKKQLPIEIVDLRMDADTGKFSGYASVFNGVDSYGDTILPGAFKDALLNGMPKMFFNHQWDIPVGKYTSGKEDFKGLFVEGELTKGMTLANDVCAAMKHETIDGLSIGGYLKEGDYTETENGRIIHKWSKLVEISLVAFPADSNARISSVKSSELIPDIKTIRDFEHFLRDAGGFSKSEAVALASRVKSIFKGDPEKDDTAKLTAILARLESMKALIPH